VYLLRRAGGLVVGPGVRGALPLQQLAGGEAQPLARLVVAWLPAGGVAALALATFTRLGLAARVGAVAAGFFLTLVIAGAVSDATAVSDRFAPHLLPQLARPAIWAATALALIGALMPARPRRLRGPGRAASAV
jgi:hypothetical protein